MARCPDDPKFAENWQTVSQRSGTANWCAKNKLDNTLLSNDVAERGSPPATTRKMASYGRLLQAFIPQQVAAYSIWRVVNTDITENCPAYADGCAYRQRLCQAVRERIETTIIRRARISYIRRCGKRAAISVAHDTNIQRVGQRRAFAACLTKNMSIFAHGVL